MATAAQVRRWVHLFELVVVEVDYIRNLSRYRRFHSQQVVCKWAAEFVA